MSAFKPIPKTDEELSETFMEGFTLGMRVCTLALTQALGAFQQVMALNGIDKKFYKAFSKSLDDNKDVAEEQFKAFLERFKKNHALQSKTISRRKP